VTAFLAGVRLQLSLFRRNPGHLLIFTTVPFFAAIFLAGIGQAHRADLAPFAVMGPALIGVWAVSLDLAGSVIDAERSQGTFEMLVAAPASLSRVLAGRIVTITVFGMATLLEPLLVARFVFATAVSVVHPVVFVLALLATAVAMTGTSTGMAALFVAARSARRFSNSMNYPFYILGGLIVPVAALPIWLRPLSWVVYLSWSADLLRDTTNPAPVPDVAARLAMVVLLGVIAYAVGVALTRRVVQGLRRQGTVGLS
jgi:ABC-2 type transport system permease protein